MSYRRTLYVLDAYSMIFQVFHAIPLMTGPAGQPTNAVFGIFRDILNILKTRKPEYLAAAFDGQERVFRSDLFAEYKANRSAMPEDLRPQIATIKRLFEAFRVPVLMTEGYEADDVIATVAHRAASEDLDVVVVTADKDARQLINERIRLLNLRKSTLMDAEALQAEWGIGPGQVVDYLALTGDAVDNVPGVPSIGPKSAQELLQRFGTLEALLARVDEVKGAKQQKLRDHADAARLSKVLVTLKADVPLEFDWPDLEVNRFDTPALRELCTECGFHQFRKEIEDQSAPEVPWNTGAYQVVDTPEKLDAFVAELARQPKFSFDTETTSVDPLRADVVGYSFSWTAGEAYYIPVRGPMFDRVLEPATVLEALRPILSDPAREVVGQNLKYDMLVMQRAGLELGGAITDTMVLSYLLESGERNHNLDELAKRLLDHTMIPIESLIGKGKNQRTMNEVEVERVAAYAGEDADAALRLEALLAPKLREQGLWPLYAELERPLIVVLARMEAAGIKVDAARMRALSSEFATRLKEIERQIHEQSGRPFNISSSLQLRQVLFDELKLPVSKRTPKGEPSTDAAVLEELAAVHALPRLIVQYRHLEKLKGTYLDALPELLHADGRIHASFNQVVAATGRLSSSDPNLQNIPVRSEEGRQIRQAFVAGAPGWKLLTADYSQVELRILAHFSKDAALVDAFANDRDIHTVVASQIFGVAESQVTRDHRRVAKTVNFGVIYGLSAFGLASRLGITQGEAVRFIEAYFQEYAGVDAFITRVLEQALADGRVETILGRRRAINGIKNTGGRNRNLAERTAINTVIQGSAADLIKKAMLNIDQQMREMNMQSRMLLQIHDELVFEAPADELAPLARLVEKAMCSALPLDVPLGVDMAAGDNWLDVVAINVE